ncbi:MAG: DNA repair protein RecO [Flavobacteriales bacterium]|nr:DNA repair protein RecO [Flavobacteriales bacterium]MDW8431967.1 recombination protein O N-terminal domain-containing protein [Flavobacteriales bacterium]
MPTPVHIRALVVHRLRYGEKDLIVRCLSPEAGIQAYLLKGPARRISPAERLSHPGALVRLKILRLGARSLPKILSAESLFPQWHTFFEPVRYAQAAFVAECLHRFFPNDQACEPAYFDWAEEILRGLEQTPSGIPMGWPLRFLAGLCRVAGIAPVTTGYPSGASFHLVEAQWIHGADAGDVCLSPELSLAWFHLFAGREPGALPISQRRLLLQALVQFIRLHHSPDFEVRSPDIYSGLF